MVTWLFITESQVNNAGDSSQMSRQTSWFGWEVKLVQMVKHATVVSWVGEQAGGESGPFKSQLQVPGLNADSLHVIKNSLS